MGWGQLFLPKRKRAGFIPYHRYCCQEPNKLRGHEAFGTPFPQLVCIGHTESEHSLAPECSPSRQLLLLGMEVTKGTRRS